MDTHAKDLCESLVRKVGAAILVSSAIAGCSAGNSDDNGNPVSTNTGVFIDSPVAGLAYTSGSRSGMTDQNGGFTCEAGKAVVFSIGSVVLPAVPCSKNGVVTPLTVFGATEFSEPAVVNLARLLQTLDKDGNLANGIEISAEAHAATNILPAAFSFESNAATFESQVGSYITGVNNNGGTSNTTLVSSVDALAHLKSQFPLHGAWLFGAGAVVVTFFPDGTYVMAHLGEPDDAGQPGMERGAYTWNPMTGAFASKCPEVDTNGQWGFSHPVPNICSGTTATVTVNNNTLTMNFGDGGSLTAARLIDASKPRVGSWYLPATNNVVITFLFGSMYMHVQNGPASGGGQSGIEFGAYTWDTTIGEFTTLCPNVDTNGEWGLSHPTPGECTGSTGFADVAGDVMTLGIAGGMSLDLKRVGQ